MSLRAVGVGDGAEEDVPGARLDAVFVCWALREREAGGVGGCATCKFFQLGSFEAGEMGEAGSSSESQYLSRMSPK